MEDYKEAKKRYIALQRGSGRGPYRVVVIGAGNPTKYGPYFLELGQGGGIGYDEWKTASFWRDLHRTTLESGLLYKVVVFAEDSETWLRTADSEVQAQLVTTVTSVIDEKGFILLPTSGASGVFGALDNVSRAILSAGVPVTGMFRYTDSPSSYSRIHSRCSLADIDLLSLDGISPPSTFSLASPPVPEQTVTDFVWQRLVGDQRSHSNVAVLTELINVEQK